MPETGRLRAIPGRGARGPLRHEMPAVDEAGLTAARQVDRVIAAARTLGADRWVAYFELWSEVTRPERRRWMDLVEPWASRRPRTLDKESFSKWGPELRDLAGESKTLVLCGVATDCCVISTALPAADDGMFVRIAADACRGATADAHAHALAIMGGYAPQIVVSTVGDELTRLDGSDARLGSPSGQSLM